MTLMPSKITGLRTLWLTRGTRLLAMLFAAALCGSISFAQNAATGSPVQKVASEASLSGQYGHTLTFPWNPTVGFQGMLTIKAEGNKVGGRHVLTIHDAENAKQTLIGEVKGAVNGNQITLDVRYREASLALKYRQEMAQLSQLEQNAPDETAKGYVASMRADLEQTYRKPVVIAKYVLVRVDSNQLAGNLWYPTQDNKDTHIALAIAETPEVSIKNIFDKKVPIQFVRLETQDDGATATEVKISVGARTAAVLKSWPSHLVVFTASASPLEELENLSKTAEYAVWGGELTHYLTDLLKSADVSTSGCIAIGNAHFPQLFKKHGSLKLFLTSTRVQNEDKIADTGGGTRVTFVDENGNPIEQNGK